MSILLNVRFTSLFTNHTTTLVGNQSVIEAMNGNLYAQGEKNIESLGSLFKASGQIGLKTLEGDINLKALEVASGYNQINGGNFDKKWDLEYLRTTLDGAMGVQTSAGGKLNMESINVVSAGNVILTGNEGVTNVSLNDVHYTDTQRSRKRKFGGKKVSRNMSYAEETQESLISGANILVQSETGVSRPTVPLALIREFSSDFV